MLDLVRGSIQGFVKILDKDTGEILVDTHNDVLYGNISTALAQSLIGNPNSLLSYMAFGNGGAYVHPTGVIAYKPSLGGAGSLVKDVTANLYNTIYIKKISNNATTSPDYDINSTATITGVNQATNYEDITIDVTLVYNELAIQGFEQIQQSQFDNSSFVGTPSNTAGVSTGETMVFNEIGLFAGSDNLLAGFSSTTIAEINAFVAQGYNPEPNTTSKLMITHAIFHPVQKAQNRALQIIYTLRVQIGAN